MVKILEFFKFFKIFLAKIPEFWMNSDRTPIWIVRLVRSLADRTFQLRSIPKATVVPRLDTWGTRFRTFGWNHDTPTKYAGRSHTRTHAAPWRNLCQYVQLHERLRWFYVYSAHPQRGFFLRGGPSRMQCYRMPVYARMQGAIYCHWELVRRNYPLVLRSQ